VISDNKLAQNAGWNREMLAIERPARDWHRPSVAALSVALRRRTRRDASASILTALAGIAVDKSVHGVAFLSWNQHPEPTSSM
jgi:hypothetical protein